MSAHEIFHSKQDSVSLTFSGGELKIREAGSLSGYGIRALERKRLGFAYCQREGELKRALEEAERISRFSPESPFSFAPQSKYRVPDIFDKSLDPSDYEEARSFVEQAKEAAESKGGNARIIFDAGSSVVDIENSEGFHGVYRKTDFSLYSECMNGDGFGFGFLSSCKKPKEVRETGLKAAEMARAMQGATKPQSGTYTMVAGPEALGGLIDTLMPSFSGDWKRRHMSKLSSGKKAFSGKFTFCEDGLSRGSNARPFDDEGTASEERVLVDRGVVKSFLYDRETAALEGTDGSGACSRGGFDSIPSISPSNLVVKPGTWKDLGELERYIELHSAHGSHTANPTNGDIGLEASVAFLVEHGERKPVKGFMVSGNVFDMFANIEGIEKEQQEYGSLVSPRIAFKGVRVVA